MTLSKAATAGTNGELGSFLDVKHLHKCLFTVRINKTCGKYKNGRKVGEKAEE